MSQRSTTTWVVNDGLDQSADVTMSFGEIEGAKLGWGLAKAVVGGEDRATTLSLIANDSTLFKKSVSHL